MITKKILILSIILSIIIGGGIVFGVMQYFELSKVKTETQIKKVEEIEGPETKQEIIEEETVIEEEKFLDEVIFKYDKEERYPTEVYLKELNTGKETFILSLENMSYNVRKAEYINGNLYVMQKSFAPETRSSFERYELWRFDQNKSGKLLFSARDFLNFSVSPDEEMIAIYYYSNRNINDQFIAFIENTFELDLTSDNNPTEKIKSTAKKMIYDPPTQIRSFMWSADSKNLLFYSSDISIIDYITKISADSWDIINYDIGELAARDIILNPYSNKILYTNCPILHDVPSEEELKNLKSSLNLYDLETKKQSKIDERIGSAGCHEAKWVSNTTYEYSIPGDTKVTRQTIQ